MSVRKVPVSAPAAPRGSLERWGIEWRGADRPCCVRLPDGYWTPWHLAQEAIADLNDKVFLKGHWRCAKCDFYLVSTNLHAESGAFSPNDSPQQCANGCGPMWRVTHEQSANTVCDRLDKAADEIKTLRETLRAVATALPVLQTMCKVAGLEQGRAKAAEMLAWIEGVKP